MYNIEETIYHIQRIRHILLFLYTILYTIKAYDNNQGLPHIDKILHIQVSIFLLVYLYVL